MGAFTLHDVRNVHEACRLLLDHAPDIRLLAGGTDLIPGIRTGRLKPRHLVTLNSLRKLKDIVSLPDNGLRIGALASLSSIASHPVVCTRYQTLAEACRSVGSVQIQNIGTMVGNICNASPAADTAPALLVLEAGINTVGVDDRRTIPISDFFLGPGRTALRPGEVVESVDLPPCERTSASCYLKMGRTRGVDLAVVGVAVQLSVRAVPRLAFASVAPTPLQVREAETLLASEPFDVTAVEAATRAVLDAIRPITDIRASAEYRTAMASVLLRRALELVRRRLSSGE